MNIKFCLTTLILLSPLTQTRINATEDRSRWLALGCSAAVVGYVVYQYLYSSAYKNITDIDAKDADGSTALHRAIMHKSVEVVKKLLQDGASTEITTKNGCYPLDLAIAYDKYEIAELLLEYGANIDVKSRDYQSTALHQAVILNNSRQVKWLLVHGADVNTKTSSGMTPLHWAAYTGNAEIAKELLKYGAQINDLDKRGNTPLHIVAISSYNIETAKELIAAGANVNAVNSDNDRVLDFALNYHADEKIISFLKQNGARLKIDDDISLNKNFNQNPINKYDCDIDVKDADGSTALHRAIMHRSVEAVKKLLEDGASTEVTDKYGNYPLHQAILWCCYEIAELLLEHGANIDAMRSDFQTTALHQAVLFNNSRQVKWLLARGADINASSDYGLTPWNYALLSKNLAVIKAFILHFGDMRMLLEEEITELHIAVLFDLVEDVQRLIVSQVDVNAKTRFHDMTPLHWASYFCNAKIAKELLMHGAQANAFDKDGNTPLHIAACSFYGNSEDIISTLLEYGANIHAQNNDGNTPLHLAIIEKNYCSVRILLKNNADHTIKNNDQKTVRDCTLNQELTPLLWAVIMQDTKQITKLIAQEDSINVSNNKLTPIHLASKLGLVEMVKFLILQKANVNAVNVIGQTPLHIIMQHGTKKKIEIVNELIISGANVNALDNGDKTVLDYALCYNADEEIVALLKQYGGVSRNQNISNKHDPDINMKDTYGLTALHRAIINRSILVVKKLLQDGASTEITTQDGHYPLHLAVFHDYPEITKLLLEYGANIEVVDQHGNYPLIVAICLGWNEIAQLLLEYGANIETMNKSDQFTALMFAVEKGNIQIVQRLLLHKANVNAYDQDQKTALMWVIIKGFTEIAEMLINAGANLETQESTQLLTALHYAVFFKNLKIVKLLIAHGVDINAKTSDGFTALHLATNFDNAEIAKELLKHGAQVNSLDNNGGTPLHFTSMSSDVISTLLEYGAHINAQNKYGNTPLHLAVLYGLDDTVEILLKNNADVTIKNNDQKTAHDCHDQRLKPLQIAVLVNDTQKIAELLSQGFDINEQDFYGETALHFASKWSLVEMVKFLILQKANVNAVNAVGQTPLHSIFLFTGNRKIEVVEELIASGADVNVLDNFKKTALDYALWFNEPEKIIDLLKRHGARSRI